MSNETGQLQSVPQCTVPTYIVDIPSCYRQLLYPQTLHLLHVNFAQLHNLSINQSITIIVHMPVNSPTKYSHLSLHTFLELQTSLLWLLYFGSCAIVTPSFTVNCTVINGCCKLQLVSLGWPSMEQRS